MLLGRDVMSEHGFRTGQIFAGSIKGLMPTSFLVRVSAVTTTTTVFRCEVLEDLDTSQGSRLDDLFNNVFAVMGIKCASALNNKAIRDITDFDSETGEFTTSAMPGTYTVDDVLMIDLIGNLIAASGGIVFAGIPTTLANGETTLFNILGGDVRVFEIAGKVTTEVGAGVTNAKIVYDNAVSAADIDLCTVADINGDIVQTRYRLTGDISDALGVSLDMFESPGYDMNRSPLLLGPGAIHLNLSAARSGVIEWYIAYQSAGGFITPIAGV